MRTVPVRLSVAPFCRRIRITTEQQMKCGGVGLETAANSFRNGQNTAARSPRPTATDCGWRLRHSCCGPASPSSLWYGGGGGGGIGNKLSLRALKCPSKLQKYFQECEGRAGEVRGRYACRLPADIRLRTIGTILQRCPTSVASSDVGCPYFSVDFLPSPAAHFLACRSDDGRRVPQFQSFLPSFLPKRAP